MTSLPCTNCNGKGYIIVGLIKYLIGLLLDNNYGKIVCYKCKGGVLVLSEGKEILDVACGSKMFWFDKNNPDVLFCDNRQEDHILCDGRKLEISPDIIMDFRDLKFPDNHFKLVVFDPPHLKGLGKNSWMAKKYGCLGDNWRENLKQGFNECLRVLENRGILIFKWSEKDIKVKELLAIFGKTPLFGHTTNNKSQTIWLCFMKKD